MHSQRLVAGQQHPYQASVAFGGGVPSGGGFAGNGVYFCESGQLLFRLCSNQPGADHRYAISAQIRDAMFSKGWILEGAIPPVGRTMFHDVRSFVTLDDSSVHHASARATPNPALNADVPQAALRASRRVAG